MKFSNVVIRDKDAVDILDTRIALAFNNANQQGSEIPIYYQFCQERNAQLVEDPNFYVGKAKNIHFTEDGELVADCIIHSTAPIAQNFMNVIDNFFVVVTRDAHGNAVPVLRQFIIYDRMFKEQIIRKQQREESAEKRVVKILPSPMIAQPPEFISVKTPYDALDSFHIMKGGDDRDAETGTDDTTIPD